MHNHPFTPLLRSAIGFDRMVDLMNGMPRPDAGASGYPPYDIEKVSEDGYRITMAVAGFSPDQITVTAQDGRLTIAGQPDNRREGADPLYRGIARRAFQRRFALADHIEVAGAHLEHGLLHVDLVRRVPEEKKPRTIPIATGVPAQADATTAEAA
jgi:molecular chaperone IbpA